ncbi:MAG: PQQ-binding-like beta-propeller repeat protein [Arachnia propionica]|uniref:outer membrane protein assembly factor BamB family protein n=1 Tax=Arachnia propionica TaxID=1750 RepID=UPI0026F4C9EC|nr:PQQ-binding-like beta-propeller repeat protein [Arachnia propionica]
MMRDNVDGSSVVAARVPFVWPFLVGVIAMLWLCGVVCWGLAVVTRPGDGADLFGFWVPLGFLVLFAAGAVAVERFGGQSSLWPGLCCSLVAAFFLLLVVRSLLRDPPRGRRVDVDADPSVLWTVLVAGCIGVASLVLALLVVLRARGWAVVRVGQPRGRVVALLCGVLVAGLGTVGGAVLVRGELALTRAVTTTVPDSLPVMAPVLDVKQATGEVVWTHEWPEAQGNVELHAGVRGPIAADRDTVIGLDGATGEVLWRHELQKQKELKGLWKSYGEPRKLLVSLDGASTAFLICSEDMGRKNDREDEAALVVLDAVTGRQRFALNLPKPADRSGRCHPQVAMTDHVVVVDGIAHDLVTGEQLWSVAPEPGFVKGVNGASHLLVASDDDTTVLTEQEREAWITACSSCTLGPQEIVSDQDPTAVLGKVSRVVTHGKHHDAPIMARGWLLEQDQATGANSWLNLDTRQRIPTGTIPQANYLDWKTDTLAVSAPDETPEEVAADSRWAFHVLDPWTGETGTVIDPGGSRSDGPLGVGAWAVVSSYHAPFEVQGPDGSVIGAPLVVPVPSGYEEDWYHIGSIRTPHGIATGFTWGLDSSVIVMHR